MSASVIVELMSCLAAWAGAAHATVSPTTAMTQMTFLMTYVLSSFGSGETGEGDRDTLVSASFPPAVALRSGEPPHYLCCKERTVVRRVWYAGSSSSDESDRGCQRRDPVARARARAGRRTRRAGSSRRWPGVDAADRGTGRDREDEAPCRGQPSSDGHRAFWCWRLERDSWSARCRSGSRASSWSRLIERADEAERSRLLSGSAAPLADRVRAGGADRAECRSRPLRPDPWPLLAARKPVRLPARADRDRRLSVGGHPIAALARLPCASSDRHPGTHPRGRAHRRGGRARGARAATARCERGPAALATERCGGRGTDRRRVRQLAVGGVLECLQQGHRRQPLPAHGGAAQPADAVHRPECGRRRGARLAGHRVRRPLGLFATCALRSGGGLVGARDRGTRRGSAAAPCREHGRDR